MTISVTIKNNDDPEQEISKTRRIFVKRPESKYGDTVYPGKELTIHVWDGSPLIIEETHDEPKKS